MRDSTRRTGVAPVAVFKKSSTVGYGQLCNHDCNQSKGFGVSDRRDARPTELFRLNLPVHFHPANIPREITSEMKIKAKTKANLPVTVRRTRRKPPGLLAMNDFQ